MRTLQIAILILFLAASALNFTIAKMQHDRIGYADIPKNFPNTRTNTQEHAQINNAAYFREIAIVVVCGVAAFLVRTRG